MLGDISLDKISELCTNTEEMRHQDSAQKSPQGRRSAGEELAKAWDELIGGLGGAGCPNSQK